MDSPTQKLVTYFIQKGQFWVAAEREFHRPNGRALTSEEFAALCPYFKSTTLDSIVIREVPLIENPGFYAGLPAIPLDFSQMSGITFVDTIVIGKKRFDPQKIPWLSLLFHECVHVCQYKVLGVTAFIKQYVEGWAEHGFNYYAIPFEVQAYQLQQAYETAEHPFSAEQVIEKTVAASSE
jgi:hypothetical protein